jgi:hypothetical protein
MKYRLLASFTLLVSGCVKAPDLVMVDRATALEQQAGGSFDALEQDLAERAVAARPEPLTPAQLEALGLKPAPLVERSEQTQADRLDLLLKQRCVGEGKDGLLVDTHDACIGASDLELSTELVDRTNRARLQLFRWLHGKRPEVTLDALKQDWHKTHLEGVVCRGWVQADDGTWSPKAC